MSKKESQQETAIQEEEVIIAETDDNTTENGHQESEETSSETQLTEELEDMKKQHDELKDKYMRLLADFDNYKKRTLKEKIEFMTTAAQDTLSALLPVLDDFDRAKKNAEDDASTEQFSEGVTLVYNKLYNILQQKGLAPMETNGEVFNPELHEAITEIPVPNEDMKGKVIDTVERGYKLKDKIIRHPKVVVGK